MAGDAERDRDLRVDAGLTPLAGASSGRPRRRIAAAATLAAAVLVLVTLGIVAWRWTAAQGIDITALTPEGAEAFVHSWGSLGVAGSIVLMMLHSFLPLPAEAIPVINGMMFGPGWGIVVTWVGAMLGAILSFALARWLGRPLVRLFLSEAQCRRIDTFPARPGTLLVVRLIPVISFNLVNYAAGLLEVPWWTFLWTTGLGILPLTAAMVLAGRQLMGAPWWAWLLVGLGALALWLSFRLLRRRVLG